MVWAVQEAKQRQLSNCAALIAVCLKRVEKKKGGLMPEWEVRATPPLADDLSRWAASLTPMAPAVPLVQRCSPQAS